MTNRSKNNRIITTLEELKPILSACREKKQRIVLTQGSFDMIHIGHARYFQEAKKHGDVLIVGVDSDEKIRHRKGPDRPVVPQDERLEMLTYLRNVDYSVLKELNAPKWELIKLIKPDVLIATRETYTDEEIAKLGEWCGKVVVLAPMATTSTSAKIRRMQISLAKKMSAYFAEILAELKGEK